ncbi:MAG: hypothetical protein ACLFST_09800 [Spirochaetia bacterium]
MKRSLFFSVLVLGIFLFLPERAEAGQLHINLLGLQDIANQAGYALGVVILGVNAAERTVRVLVERIWTGKGSSPEGFTSELLNEDGSEVVYINSETYKAGQEYEFPIYEGVEWTDPDVSPMDFRVRGAVSLETVKPGDKTVVLQGWGKEMVPRTGEMDRKLELFFSENGVEQYRESVTVDVLKRDLSDPDLREIAYEELEKKGSLTPEVIVKAAGSAPDVFQFVIAYLRPLPEREQTVFFETAIPILAAEGDAKLIGHFLLLLRNTYGTDPEGKIKSSLIRLLEDDGTPEAVRLLEMYR